jgi:uncharacterized protein YrzB (UPF0473 family)
VEKNNGKIMITNNKGEELECDVLFTFDDDKLNKSYIVYTDNSLDDNGQIKVYASTYDKEGNDLSLGKIETEEEWDNIENILSSLNNKFEDNDAKE